MRGNFLVINFQDDHWEIDGMRADFGNKEIKFLFQKKINLESWKELAEILAGSFYFRQYGVILAFDSANAWTGYRIISLGRDNPKKPFEEAELDNLISRVVWKIWEDGRRMSAVQLKLNDAEIILMRTNVHDFKIDGRREVEPVGKSGRLIEIDLSQTFVSRPVFSKIISLLPRRVKIVFAVDAGVAASRLILKSRSPEKSVRNFIFAKVGNAKTEVYSFDRPAGRTEFWDYFRWGAEHFYEAVGRYLRVGPRLAESILEKFFKGEVSSAFGNHLGRVVKEELITLIRGIKHAAAESKSAIAYLDFPLFTRGTGLISKTFFPTMIRGINSEEITDFFGFQYKNFRQGMKGKKKIIGEPDFSALAALLEFYFLPPDDSFNRIAKRKMRWLVPQ